jgi:hypothetical protein
MGFFFQWNKQYRIFVSQRRNIMELFIINYQTFITALAFILFYLISWQLVQTAEKTGVLKETSLPQVTDNFIIKLYPVHLLTMGIYKTHSVLVAVGIHM